MARIMKLGASVVWVTLMTAAISQAQTQHQTESLSIQGHSGRANVVRLEGRVFVDAQDLASITNGSLTFNRAGIILALPGCGASE